MKKYFLSMTVIAFFAIGFAASGDDDDEEVMYYDGQKFRKVWLKCEKCDQRTYYWQSTTSSTTIDKPYDRLYKGEYYYCMNHYPD